MSGLIKAVRGIKKAKPGELISSISQANVGASLSGSSAVQRLDELPDNVLIRILSYLPRWFVVQHVVLVNRRFYLLCSTPNPVLFGMVDARRCGRPSAPKTWTQTTLNILHQSRFREAKRLLLGDLNFSKKFWQTVASYVPRVEELEVEFSTRFRDKALKHAVACFPSLTVLNVFGCRRISADGFLQLTGVASLKKLVFGQTMIDDRYFEATCIADKKTGTVACAGVTHVLLNDCPNITAKAFVLIGQACRELIYLRAEHTTIDSTGLQSLAQGCPQLRVLRLRDVAGPLELGPLKALTKLSHLLLRGCAHITTESVQSWMAIPRPSLTIVNLADCPLITNRAAYTLLCNATNLQQLNLRSTGVTPELWTAVAARRPALQLRYLNLRACHVDTSALLAFAAMPALQTLVLSETQAWSIDMPEIELFRDGFVAMQRLDLRGIRVSRAQREILRSRGIQCRQVLTARARKVASPANDMPDLSAELPASPPEPSASPAEPVALVKVHTSRSSSSSKGSRSRERKSRPGSIMPSSSSSSSSSSSTSTSVLDPSARKKSRSRKSRSTATSPSPVEPEVVVIPTSKPAELESPPSDSPVTRPDSPAEFPVVRKLSSAAVPVDVDEDISSPRERIKDVEAEGWAMRRKNKSDAKPDSNDDDDDDDDDDEADE